MSEKEIQMIGADENQYRLLMRSVSRLVEFPDSIARILRLSHWESRVVDWVENEQGYGEGMLAKSAFGQALLFAPRRVLQVLQLPAWDQRPAGVFNRASQPVSPAQHDFRANAEDMTGQARRAFERELYLSYRCVISVWMERYMGLGEPANRPCRP